MGGGSGWLCEGTLESEEGEEGEGNATGASLVRASVGETGRGRGWEWISWYKGITAYDLSRESVEKSQASEEGEDERVRRDEEQARVRSSFSYSSFRFKLSLLSFSCLLELSSPNFAAFRDRSFGEVSTDARS